MDAIFVEKNTESKRLCEQTRPTDDYYFTEHMNATEPLNGINQLNDGNHILNSNNRSKQIDSGDFDNDRGKNLTNLKKRYRRKIPIKIIEFLNEAIYFYYDGRQTCKFKKIQSKIKFTKKDAQELFKQTIKDYLKRNLSKKYKKKILPSRKHLGALSRLEKVDFFQRIFKLTLLDFCVYFNSNEKDFLIRKCKFQGNSHYEQIINNINVELEEKLSNNGTDILKSYGFKNINIDIETLSEHSEI